MKEKILIDIARQSVISLPEETQFAENGIVSRTLFDNGQARTVLFGFSEGQQLTEHTSTKQALVQILSGESDWTLAGEPRRLKAGDLLFMPAHLPHSVCAVTRFSMMLTLFSPTSPEAQFETIKL